MKLKILLSMLGLTLGLDVTATRKSGTMQLKSSPDSVKWPNIFLIIELLFSLPFSTAKVECLFSILKIIKNERRASLNCSTLNDLLEVNVEGLTLSNFSPDSVVNIWWSNCQSRRVNQKPRKEYRRRQNTTEASSSEDSEAEQLDIDKWDSWFGNDDQQLEMSLSSDSHSDPSD